MVFVEAFLNSSRRGDVTRGAKIVSVLECKCHEKAAAVLVTDVVSLWYFGEIIIYLVPTVVLQ